MKDWFRDYKTNDKILELFLLLTSDRKRLSVAFHVMKDYEMPQNVANFCSEKVE